TARFTAGFISAPSVAVYSTANKGNRRNSESACARWLPPRAHFFGIKRSNNRPKNRADKPGPTLPALNVCCFIDLNDSATTLRARRFPDPVGRCLALVEPGSGRRDVDMCGVAGRARLVLHFAG